MTSKSPSTNLAMSCALALLFLGLVTSNVDQDRAECTDQVVGLATCLPYVGGEAKAPTPDCCSGLRLVVQKSMKCLCVLIKDRNDPTLGLKVNLTLALGLPNVCHTPANITDCIGLLHLPPNSAEAKDFLGLSAKGANVTSAPTASSNPTEKPDVKNDGGMRKQRMGVEIFISCIVLFTSIW
ncbi:Protein YLS3 [Cucurbita argyrosperma subsp. argyrosperma]